MAPDGRTLAVYRKIHLVPFGEFIPYGDWLAFFPPAVYLRWLRASPATG